MENMVELMFYPKKVYFFYLFILSFIYLSIHFFCWRGWGLFLLFVLFYCLFVCFGVVVVFFFLLLFFLFVCYLFFSCCFVFFF